MLGVKNTHGCLLLAGIVIAMASLVEGILNCESTNSIQAAYKSCLHQEDINIKLMDHNSASLEDALVSEQAADFCSYPRESYKRAIECIGRVSRQCMPEEYKFLIPMPQQWGEMITRICDHREDLDLQCAARQSHANTQCGKRKAHQYLQERGQPSTSELKCWVFEAEFDCVLQLYKSCGCTTAKVYSDIVLDIMMPSACGQKQRLEHRRLVCPDTQESSTPLPALPDHVTANCGSATILKSNVVECFTNEEIHDRDLFESFVNSASPPNTIIEGLFLHYGDSACSTQKLRYQEAFTCTLKLLRDCTPDNFKRFLPSPDTAPAHINYLCEHRKDINFLCASKKSTALQACGKHKAMDYVANGGSATDMDRLLCFSYKAEFECIQEVYKACGCDTARIYSDMSFDLRYPKTCPREELEQKRLRCPHKVSHHPVDMKVSQPGVTYNVDSQQCLPSRFQEIKNCYTNRGFEYIEDASNIKSHIFYGSVLDTILNQNKYMCSTRKLQSARSAVRCEAEIIHFCSTVEGKTIFPSLSKLVEVFDGLCDNWQEIDRSCAYRELRKIAHCLELPSSPSFRDLGYENQRTCSKLGQMGDCVKDNLLTCGCRTAKAYSDVVYNVMLPSACRLSDDTPQYMKCDVSNPYTYKNSQEDGGNGASKLPCTLWSLAIAVCLARLIFRYL